MRGAVLDFDGVVARSMEQHAEAYRRILRPYGVDVEDEQVFVREGARSESILRDLLSDNGQEVDDEVILRLGDEKQRLFTGLGSPPLYDGAKAMVHRIRRAAPRLGLVTGTRRENLDRLIPDLLPLFDAVLAQDAYGRDKPDPEPYAKAAEAVGLPPADLVALENAPRGVQSAKAAGYGRVVAIATTLPARDLREAGADEVVVSHEDAAAAVVRWLRAP